MEEDSDAGGEGEADVAECREVREENNDAAR